MPKRPSKESPREPATQEALRRIMEARENGARKLNLFNQLRTLPEAIGQLFQLQKLKLSGNQLSALPETIGQLSELQELALAIDRPPAQNTLTRVYFAF
jgi:hypothetical protein